MIDQEIYLYCCMGQTYQDYSYHYGGQSSWIQTKGNSLCLYFYLSTTHKEFSWGLGEGNDLEYDKLYLLFLLKSDQTNFVLKAWIKWCFEGINSPIQLLYFLGEQGDEKFWV